MTLLHSLISSLGLRHPLPWRIEHDWCIEVIDANDVVVVKLFSLSDAEELVDTATRFAAEHMARREAFERMLTDESEV